MNQIGKMSEVVLLGRQDGTEASVQVEDMSTHSILDLLVGACKISLFFCKNLVKILQKFCKISHLFASIFPEKQNNQQRERQEGVVGV